MCCVGGNLGYFTLHTLDSLWDGWGVGDEALTVRRAFSAILPDAVGFDLYPDFSSDTYGVNLRLALVGDRGWRAVLGARLLAAALSRRPMPSARTKGRSSLGREAVATAEGEAKSAGAGFVGWPMSCRVRSSASRAAKAGASWFNEPQRSAT